MKLTPRRIPTRGSPHESFFTDAYPDRVSALQPHRDDLGRPKTAIIGGVPRLRISSQALKRAIRTSEVFRSALEGHLGARTQRMGDIVRQHLIDTGADEDTALRIAREVVGGVFGKLSRRRTSTRPLQNNWPSSRRRNARPPVDWPSGFSPGRRWCPRKEERKVEVDTKKLAAEVLQKADGAVDIAMFGRMLADNPAFNREAAVQVAHAFTTNQVDVEDDYYTAVMT